MYSQQLVQHAVDKMFIACVFEIFWVFIGLQALI